MEDNNNKNLILATALSFLVILVWFVLFPPPEPVTPPPAQTVAAETAPVAPLAEDAAAAPEGTPPVAAAPRITVETPELVGSIALSGGRIDDLSLKSYRETVDPASPTVQLFRPVGEPGAYYALYGWAPGGDLSSGDVPGWATEWTAPAGTKLTPDSPVTLSWDNGKGLRFTRAISVDDKFMFTVTDSVTNAGTAPATMRAYGVIARHGLPAENTNIFVVHEGAVSRTDGILCERKYSSSWFGCDGFKELPASPEEGGVAVTTEATSDGWIGFTDHYWMSTLIPEQGKPWTAVTKYDAANDIYQTWMRQPVMTVAPGQTASVSSRLFAGAKEWETIRAYQREQAIPGFIDSIDWGWFFFLTKPIFFLLHTLNGFIGNMGFAIIGLTFCLKFLVLPLAYKSYVSMARMKELQPEMEAIKERAGEDKQKLQREMMQLYKDRKVNPAAGCLPILIQVPIFFSLYKVIFVTIELRQAPFIGWLNDLSAPDASSLFNFFGLLPWDAPPLGSTLHLIFIGLLPILLGITMWLQQKLNPQPTDPAQAAIFAWMPWIFMFMLGSFASGLVIYWITNNLITFTQQYLIMRSHGHTPDIFGNIRASFRKAPPPAPVTGKAANSTAKPSGKPPAKTKAPEKK